jgi:hypothetical protein
MRPPPSREKWQIEASSKGHSVEQTIKYLSDCADWEDERERARATPLFVVASVGDAVCGLRGWLRRKV